MPSHLTTPVDLATSSPFALGGSVVTIDPAGTVLANGVVYCHGGSIVAVQARSAAPPGGFEHVPIVASGGTIFPGLIELHNHLPYDVIGLWQVPKTYGNRDQWSGASTPDYHRLITGPMAVLGSAPDVVAAVVRFVELRCLLGGTTTSQGVTLSSDAGIIKHFRGLVRNVEKTDDKELPAAATHIADVEAKDAAKFMARISSGKKMILHLSEGTDQAAHDHFAALQVSPNNWAITDNLIGIHCVALKDPDFAVLAAHGGAMVWSPLSNLLLYGQTANIAAARSHNVPIALGSDWAPSGSKNLLGELKVARLSAASVKAGIADAELVAMATTTPAKLLGWDGHLGSLEAGKRADLLVVAGTAGDPYARLIEATEADISLVVINGIPRVATPALMTKIGITTGPTEAITVGGKQRLLNLVDPNADPAIEALTAAEAIARLATALADLPNHKASPKLTLNKREARLAVQGLVNNRQSPRPHLPLHGKPTGPNLPSTRTLTAARAAVAAARPLPALTLGPLTAVDDPGFYDAIANEMNLPPAIKASLATYRRPQNGHK